MKIVDKMSPNMEQPQVSYHCNSCLNANVINFSTPCDGCNSKTIAVNLQNDLHGIIKDMFEHQNLSNLVDTFHEENLQRRKNKEVIVTDICDGIRYLQIDKEKYDLCLIQNCDGFPVFGSATAQVWPNFLTIIDIPIQYRKRFVILANLWFAYKKPNMHEFMNPFVKTITKLSTEGIDWTHPVSKQKINSKIFMLISVVDAQARAPLQNLNACTGYYGCSFCEQKGENYKELGSNTVYFPYNVRPSELRSQQNMLLNGIELHSELNDADKIKRRKQLKLPDPSYIKGVKGFSCLAFIPNFDIGSSFSPEYMHSCMLGVVKSHLLDILDSKNKKEPFYVGFEKNASKFLKEIKAPSFITSCNLV
jgi:Transposase family tnp2